VARDQERLNTLTQELNQADVLVAKAIVHDVTELDAIPVVLQEATQWLGGLDLLVYSAGVLFKASGENDTRQDEQMIRVNLVGAIGWLNCAAAELRNRGAGTIVGLGSVAGERGRAASPGYCASKAGLHAYMEGLRGQLHESGVQVIVIKPGPVDTPMIQGIDSPMPVDVGRAAKDINHAIRAGVPELYVPRRWRPIMAVVRAVPPSLFKRFKS
jgi:short-subunit dehydrogenase